MQSPIYWFRLCPDFSFVDIIFTMLIVRSLLKCSEINPEINPGTSTVPAMFSSTLSISLPIHLWIFSARLPRKEFSAARTAALNSICFVCSNCNGRIRTSVSSCTTASCALIISTLSWNIFGSSNSVSVRGFRILS